MVRARWLGLSPRGGLTLGILATLTQRHVLFLWKWIKRMRGNAYKLIFNEDPGLRTDPLSRYECIYADGTLPLVQRLTRFVTWEQCIQVWLEHKSPRDEGLAFPSLVLHGVALAATSWGEGVCIFLWFLRGTRCSGVQCLLHTQGLVLGVWWSPGEAPGPRGSRDVGKRMKIPAFIFCHQ